MYFLYPLAAVRMKYQGLFSVKNKKNIINKLSAEYGHRVVKVKDLIFRLKNCFYYHSDQLLFHSSHLQ